ncbi:MAG: amino acid ABC transporter substrate-binding protein [Desulfobacteraceae bacterium]|nr:MAG: amino acid ABC transporter substrate-binding protein [Desulfobacteraceae bacterium]
MMLKKLLVFGIIVLTAIAISGPVYGQDLKNLNIMTEYYPPYNYEKDDQLQGIAVDLLLAASEEAGMPVTKADINLMQWSTAYQKTVKEAGNLLFSTTRTKAREKTFKWAGPIASDNSCLMVKKENNINFNSLKDIKKKNYKIGVVQDDVAMQLLLEKGVPAENLVPRPFPGLCLIDLFRNNIDAWAYGENAVLWMLGLYGFNSSEYESALTFSEGYLYFAFNPKVSDGIVNALQKGVDTVKQNGKYDEIITTYR